MRVFCRNDYSRPEIRITSTNFFGNKHTTAEIITQNNGWLQRSPVKINTVFFKEWMAATLSGIETDILLQRVDSCN